MTRVRVVVSGTGKMGGEILRAVARDPDLEPVGVIEKLAEEGTVPEPGGGRVLPRSNDPRSLLARARPDVVIDFTNAAWTPFVARAALEAGVRPVIGTSGLDRTFIAELTGLCEKSAIGGFIAPNFAVGAVLMMHMAKIAAPFFDSAEIIELHHDQKVDSPSGTAIATAAAMVERRGKPFAAKASDRETLTGARGANLDGVSLHSVRLPGLVAHQEVLLGGLGQLLTIRHDTLSRDAFMPGVLLAVKEVMKLDRLVIGLEQLMGLE